MTTIDKTFNPYNSRINGFITVEPTDPQKRKLLSLLDSGLRNANRMRTNFKDEVPGYSEAYWSLVYFNDFILISVLDPKTEVKVSEVYTELSNTSRMINVLIAPPKLESPIYLQFVDECVRHRGASLTLRSIRLYNESDSLYELIEAYVALVPNNLGTMSLTTVTSPITGDKIFV
ncbi:ORF20 [Haliotid herpesvirus 1]|nr:ORF20 [Haliotid herpesvirus 1]